MKYFQKAALRLLSVLAAVTLLAASFPATAEAPATPTDLRPASAETEPAEQPGGEDETAPVLSGDPEEGSEGTAGESAPEETAQDGGVEEAETAAPYPVRLRAGTELYTDGHLRNKERTLAEDAVALFLDAGEESARVAYVFLNETGGQEAGEAYVRPSAFIPLTGAEQEEWRNASHPGALNVRGTFLEPAVFSETAPEAEEKPAATSTDLEAATDGFDEHPDGRIAVPEDLETVEDLTDKTDGASEKDGSPERAAVFSMSDGTLQAAYESKYENGNLPAVRDQGDWGTCWAFSAIGAMEIDLIRGGMSTALDLSEQFLVYFASHNYPYPKDGADGDSVTTSGEYLSIGGNNTIAYRILANLIGTVDESDMPYDPDSEPPIPTVYSGITAQLDGAYLISPSDREAVKKAILEHGAVGASMNSRSSFYNAENNCWYSTSYSTNHDILLVGWDDGFSRLNFNTAPPGNGAWKVRNSWGGDRDYSWISYYDCALLNADATAYDASGGDVSDFCYSYDKTPYPGGYLKAADRATVLQAFTMSGRETLQAAGVETGAGSTKLTVTARVGNTVVATGSVTAEYAGFYRIPLSPEYAVSSGTKVELEVVYQALVSGSKVSVPYEKTGSQTLSGSDGSYTFTAVSGSGGFVFNGETREGDARLKLYTKKAASSGPTKIVVSPSTVTGLKSSEEKKLTAAVTPASAAGSLTWYSSDTGAATVSQDGTVTGGRRGGTAVITAMAPNGVYGTCKVQVTRVEIKVTGVEITDYDGAAAYTIDESNAGGFKPGGTLKIRSAVSPKQPTDYSITWKSSNTSMMEVVRQEGDDCVFRVNRNGTSQITVTVTDNLNGKTFSDFLNLTVYLPVRVAGVTLDRTQMELWEGESAQLSASVTPANADNTRVTWASSDPAVATVDGSGLVQGVRDGTAVITATAADNGKTASCQVTVKTRDLVEGFVYRMYRVCLLREPDASGLAFWVDLLRSRKKTGAEVANGFYTSVEMAGRGYDNKAFVTRAYEGIMGRTPDAGGLAHWAGYLDRGVSYTYIVAGFTRSNEFRGLCEQYGIDQGSVTVTQARDRNPGITGFVSRLYVKALNRKAETDGLNHWCGILLKDPAKTSFLNVALNGFLHSKEFTGKNLNDAEFCKVLYRTFLDREADEAGLKHWVQKLQSGRSRDEVARGFAISEEFSKIMASFGIR